MALESLWMIIATGIMNLSMVAYHRLMSARLGDAYGELATLTALLNVLGVLTQGVNTTLIKAFAEEQAWGGLEAARGRFRSVLKPVGLALAVGLGLLLLLTPLAVRQLNLANAYGYWSVAFIFAVSLAAIPLRALTQGTERFGWLAFSNGSEGLGRVGLAALCVWLGFGVAGAIGGAATGLLLSLAFCLPVVLGPSAAPKKRGLDLHGLREMALDTACLGLFSLICFLDIFVLKSRLTGPAGDAVMASYSRAALVAKSFLYLASALNMVLLPRVAEARATGHAAARKILVRFLLAAALANLLGLALFWVFTPLAIDLLSGPAYEGIAPLARVFAAAVIPLALAQMVLFYLLAARRYLVLLLLLLCVSGYGLALVTLDADGFKVVAALAVTALVLLGGCLGLAFWNKD